jgi:hypothetical protein
MSRGVGAEDDVLDLGNGYRTLLSRSLAPAATVDVRDAWSLHCTIRMLVLIGSSPLGAKECGLPPDSLPTAGSGLELEA